MSQHVGKAAALRRQILWWLLWCFLAATPAFAQSYEQLSEQRKSFQHVLHRNATILSREIALAKLLKTTAHPEECSSAKLNVAAALLLCRLAIVKTGEELYLLDDPVNWQFLVWDKGRWDISGDSNDRRSRETTAAVLKRHREAVARLAANVDLVLLASRIGDKHPEECKVSMDEEATRVKYKSMFDTAIAAGDLYNVRKALANLEILKDLVRSVSMICNMTPEADSQAAPFPTRAMATYRYARGALAAHTPQEVFKRGCDTLTSRPDLNRICSTAPTEASSYAVHLALAQALKGKE